MLKIKSYLENRKAAQMDGLSNCQTTILMGPRYDALQCLDHAGGADPGHYVRGTWLGTIRHRTTSFLLFMTVQPIWKLSSRRQELPYRIFSGVNRQTAPPRNPGQMGGFDGDLKVSLILVILPT